MSGKPDGRGKLLSVSLVWFFLFLHIFLVQYEMSAGFWFDDRADICAQGEDSVYLSAADASLHGDLAADPRLEVINVRRPKENALKVPLILQLFFAAWMSFSLWGFLKRAFLLCLQSEYCPSARFLNDLLIRWKKDGKKGGQYRENINLLEY